MFRFIKNAFKAPLKYTPVNSSAHYLPDSEDDEKLQTKISHRRVNILVPTLFHSLLVLINLWVFSTVYRGHCSLRTEYRDLEESPAAVAISLESRLFKAHDIDLARQTKLYFGEPSDAVIKAWSNLTRYKNIVISEEVMEGLGRTSTYDGVFICLASVICHMIITPNSVKLPDGSGYLATLNVYHNLHCLEQVHRFIYRDTYIPEMSTLEFDAMLFHVEHCLESLRESVMCKADMSLITMRWGDQESAPLPNWTFPHVCQKWDDLEDWSKKHNVPNAMEKNWLMHPTLGWAYKDVNRVGVVFPLPKDD